MASGAGTPPSAAAYSPTMMGNGNGNGNSNAASNKRIKTESGFVPSHMGGLPQQHFGSQPGHFGYHHSDHSRPLHTSLPGSSMGFQPQPDYHASLPNGSSHNANGGFNHMGSVDANFYGGSSMSSGSMAASSMDASAFLSQPVSFGAFTGGSNSNTGSASSGGDWADLGFLPGLNGPSSQEANAGRSAVGGAPLSSNWPEAASSPPNLGSAPNEIWGGPSPSPGPSAPTPSGSSLLPHVPMGPPLAPSQQQQVQLQQHQQHQHPYLQQQQQQSQGSQSETQADNGIMPPHGPPRDLHVEPIPGAPPGKQRKKAQPKPRKKKNKAENAASGEADTDNGEAADTSLNSQAATQGPKAPKKKRKPKQQQQQEQEQQQQQQQGGGDAIVPAPAESTATEAIEAPQSSGALPKTPLDGQIPQPPDAQPGQVAATIPPAPSHRLPLSRGQAVTSAPTQTQTAQGVDALQDVIGSSGVDLGAEEHAMGLQGAQASGEVRAAVYANSSSFLDPFTLSARVLQIAKKNDLQVEGAVLQYLSLATKSRVRSLVESMITASRHRTWSSHEREPSFWERKKSLEDGATPMYHQRIRTDPQKQLRALERVERTNEQAARRIRFERDEKEAAGTLDDDVEMADGGISREATKKRPLGAAAQAKNMSEDVRRRLANNTAARALGPAANTPKWMQMSAAVNASAAASPLANRTGSVSAEDKGSSADVSGTSTPGGLGALPRPRFAPQPSGILSQGSVKGSGLSGGLKKEWSGLAPHAHTGRVSVTGAVDGNIKSSGWADLAERQRAKEAEEKARARQVTMQDALHALEMEAPASLGRGSGRRALYRARAVGYATEHSRTDT